MLLAAASAALIATSAFGATDTGRPVQTETIIVPPDPNDSGDIPADDKATAPDSQTAPDSETQEPSGTPPPAEAAPAKPADTGPPPLVEYDMSKLPSPVKRLREQIMQAAQSGDIEKLRPIFDANGEVPVLGFVDDSADPVEFLKSQSGDPDGREILAILYEVLEAGYVHVDVGTPDEMYIWPYFARYPLDKLDGKQMVEMFKLLTAGDYEDMKTYGGYLFYRVGISPNGVWRYFVSGE
jgi:hypothetical protein